MTTEAAAPEGAEKHAFTTEVQQILHLMIHSLYSKREVFLRELVSNASDALDTLRFLSLTEPEMRQAEEPAIHLAIDKEKRTLSISDNGIGMTRDEVVKNIGTIARSGSGALLKSLKERGSHSAPELIGQFGVGFYSSFMVAERVELETLSARPGAEAVAWVSSGDGTYSIMPAHRSHPGTKVTLHLKPDADEFLEAFRIEQVVREYSNYVKWPILLAGKVTNQPTALWTRRPSEVSDEEHKRFFQELAGGFGDDAPLARVHISLDAPYQFQALLYIPKKLPFDLLFDHNKRRGVQLYVRRVFILDHAEELLPPYLRFVRGVVDSDDLPLNVSREMLQKNQVVSAIRKQLIKKVLEELRRIKESQADDYRGFFEEFGTILKEGVFLDADNREKVADLLLYETMKGAPRKLISLAEYVAAMPEGQKEIYYITGTSREQVAESPHLEALARHGLDVLFLIEPIDEWVAQGLAEYGGRKLRSVQKGDLDLAAFAEKGAKEVDVKEGAKAEGESDDLALGGLVSHLRVRFQDQIKEVRLTSRLTESPSCLVFGEHDLGPNLEQILRRANRKVAEAKPILELNPKNGFVKGLAALVKEAPHAEDTGRYCDLVLDLAYLSQGVVRRPGELQRALAGVLERALARG